MKKYLLAFSIACLGFTALAQETPYLTKSLASSGIKEVYVETSGGSITVSGAASEPRPGPIGTTDLDVCPARRN